MNKKQLNGTNPFLRPRISLYWMHIYTVLDTRVLKLAKEDQCLCLEL